MTAIAEKIERPGFRKLVSAIVAVADTIDMAGLDETMPHCFAGIETFSNGTGTPAVAGAGTVAVTLKTSNCPEVFEPPLDGSIAAPTPTTVGWDANTKAVKLVPTGITTATHWRATITQNCK